MEVIRQNEGPSSSVRVQVGAVSCDECGAIPWDELQVSRFSQPIRLQIVFRSSINSPHFVVLSSLCCWCCYLAIIWGRGGGGKRKSLEGIYI